MKNLRFQSIFNTLNYKVFSRVFSTFILLTLLNSCNESNKTTDEKLEKSSSNQFLNLNNEQLKNIDISFTKLKQIELKKKIKLNGKIDVPSQSRLSISLPISGILTEMNLTPGQKINKGQVLAVVKDAKIIELQKEYLTTKNKLFITQKDLERQKELNTLKANSDKTLQNIEYEVQNLKINLKSLEEQLNLIGINYSKLNESNIQNNFKIYSPNNGFVVEIKSNIGRYINLGDVILELVKDNDIHLVLEAFDKDINLLQIGQKVASYSMNNDKHSYNAEIVTINKSVSKNNIVEVHCHINNIDNNLIIGKFMYGEIEINDPNVIAIENDAIVDYENRKFIYIKRGDDKLNNKFEKLEVKTGIINKEFTEILAIDNKELISLNDNNFEIVRKGAYTLLMEENK